jgi:hypothetical protein
MIPPPISTLLFSAVEPQAEKNDDENIKDGGGAAK